MPEFIQFVYTVGSPALILGIIVFGLYKVFTHFFDRYFENAKADIQKDIENYKKELDNEKQAFIFSLQKTQLEDKNQLDRLLHEHQIQFSTLYNERNQVINELFGLLVILYGKTKELISIIKVIPPGITLEDYDTDLINQIKELNEKAYYLYSPNRLYFLDKISTDINSFRKLLENIVAEYNLSRQMKSVNLQTIGILSDKVVNAESDLKAIEIEFRKILGVE